MAELTTTEGYAYTFSPGSVFMVTDRDIPTGEAVTCVRGVGPGWLKIDETVDGFLDRVGIAAHFAQLTRADGSAVWISGRAAGALSAPLPGEYADSVVTLVEVASLIQGVQETLDDAKAALNAHGGDL